jgi:hypothetical protein
MFTSRRKTPHLEAYNILACGRLIVKLLQRFVGFDIAQQNVRQQFGQIDALFFRFP